MLNSPRNSKHFSSCISHLTLHHLTSTRTSLQCAPHPTTLQVMPHHTSPHTSFHFNSHLAYRKLTSHCTPLHLMPCITSHHTTPHLTSLHHIAHLTSPHLTPYISPHHTCLQDLLSLLVSDAAEGQVPGWFREQVLSESARLEPSGTGADNSDRRDAKRSRKAGGSSRKISQEGREEVEEGGSVLRVKLQMCDTLYRLLQGEPSSWRWHSTLRTAGREEVEAAAEVRECALCTRV